ncbi:MAG: TerB family tellurite resistance protein [Gammaproteobacteria bacterium]
MKLFKKLFPSVSDDVADAKSDTDQLQIATCLLLIEVSKSDDEFTRDEEEKIKSLLKNKFEIPNNELEDIFQLYNTKHDAMTSLYECTEIINKECSYEQKLKIISYMWDVAFTDSKIDKYEDYTIRKVSELIYVKHKDFISLKNSRAT